MNSISMPLDCSRFRLSSSSRSVIRCSCSVSSLRKITISSIRLRNSGRIDSRNLAITRSRSGFSADSASPVVKPSPPDLLEMMSEPRLLVMITTVFLKSTVRP